MITVRTAANSRSLRLDLGARLAVLLGDELDADPHEQQRRR